MLGYGYRSMKPEELKGYAMEAEFNDLGCKLTLWSGDVWHATSFNLTFQQLSEWKESKRCTDDLAWARSEFVRQVLEDSDRALLMPHSGERHWRSQFALHHSNSDIHNTLEHFGQIA
jgi:hypothetical protein